MIFVTSYDSPDIDGIACSIAYSELLNTLRKQTKPVYSGDLGLEVEFVKKYTNYFPAEKHESAYESNAQFILVDTANPDDIDPKINPEKVIEVFDHRPLVFTEKFINTQKTIEQVGSCATLIIEQFKKHNQIPSKNAAIYLYSAIVSNTTNFKTQNTTQRDIDAAEWMRIISALPDDYITQLFTAKSNINENNIFDALFQDLKTQVFKDKKIGIAQLEIANLEKTLTGLKNELENSLLKIKTEEKLDYILFDGIDILDAYTIFYTIDEGSNMIFAKALVAPDLEPHSFYKINQIILRKAILPKIGEVI